MPNVHSDDVLHFTGFVLDQLIDAVTSGYPQVEDAHIKELIRLTLTHCHGKFPTQPEIAEALVGRFLMGGARWFIDGHTAILNGIPNCTKCGVPVSGGVVNVNEDGTKNMSTFRCSLCATRATSEDQNGNPSKP